jgi:hypothetical protein
MAGHVRRLVVLSTLVVVLALSMVSSAQADTTVSPTPPTTITDQGQPVTAGQFQDLENEVVLGLSLLVFLGSVHVVGSWGRR